MQQKTGEAVSSVQSVLPVKLFLLGSGTLAISTVASEKT